MQYGLGGLGPGREQIEINFTPNGIALRGYFRDTHGLSHDRYRCPYQETKVLAPGRTNCLIRHPQEVLLPEVLALTHCALSEGSSPGRPKQSLPARR